jgi:predicted enzyme related to lactoylglutathione lyase
VAGRPIWYELMTPDPAAVAPFYKATLGWDVQGLGTQTPTGHPYWMIGRADGGHAGGVILLTPEMQMSGGQPAWIPYFEVDDVAATVESAQSLGAKVWLPPMTMDVGTMAMLGDPQGATFYVMAPKPPEGQPDATSDAFKSMVPGHCWWNELETTDEPGATAFYAALFGWNTEQTMSMGEHGDYRFVAIDGEQIGAINPWLPDYLTVGWLPYFGVADIDAAKAAAEATGGTVTHDVHEVPGGGFIFTATDPAGAAVGFVGPKGAQS